MTVLRTKVKKRTARFFEITEDSPGVPAKVKICEQFVGFIVVKKTFLTLKIPLENIQGCYNNGENISGRRKSEYKI